MVCTIWPFPILNSYNLPQAGLSTVCVLAFKIYFLLYNVISIFVLSINQSFQAKVFNYFTLAEISDVVVLVMQRHWCIQRLKVQYAPECKILNERKKGNDLERVCKALLGSKAKSWPPNQSVKFKSKIWPEITRKFAKKCLDASSM